MNRKILLIEPNYKNKYPPMGLMKLATYFRKCGDDVRFFKGDLKDFVADMFCEELTASLNLSHPEILWTQYFSALSYTIKTGKLKAIENISAFKDDDVLNEVKSYMEKYRKKEYFTNPRFDKVGITTLFTFHWDITIKTINFAKRLCKSADGVLIGGVMASLLPNEIYRETGIMPHVGLLNHRGDIDEGNGIIIDTLPLDYSILEEIDYEYPTRNAYFAYMTRGCVNKCKFCAVPKLEPKYCSYVGLSRLIKNTDCRFGAKRDLLLLDNNVLASECFEKIIDEIKASGFGKDAVFTDVNEYDITIHNLRTSYNDRAYIRKTVKLYKALMLIVDNCDCKAIESKLAEAHCLDFHTASKEEILRLDDFIRPIYAAYYAKRRKRSLRKVDFNQGLDARLVTKEKMLKLSEINISPLRIAFDHWSLRKEYVKAIKIAVACGIRHLSNYLLYNFEDTPEELYNRLRLNVELCEELNATIYSFPMKYHPISDPDYFKNRNYIGRHWNKKFIRAVQAILNATKGKVGRGLSFFEGAFGRTYDEFEKIMWMPETFIIYRGQYDERLREKLGSKYNPNGRECDLTNEWWKKFSSLPPEKADKAKAIIAKNVFINTADCDDPDIQSLLEYYKITREDALKPVNGK